MVGHDFPTSFPPRFADFMCAEEVLSANPDFSNKILFSQYLLFIIHSFESKIIRSFNRGILHKVTARKSWGDENVTNTEEIFIIIGFEIRSKW